MKHCKKCRKDQVEIEFKLNERDYKTCNTCRRTRKQGRKLTLEDCQAVAKQRMGECLSTKYKNNRTKMMWRCEQKHEWKSNFDNIKRGKWCRVCAGCQTLTIEECQTLATERGGECLSTEYKNNRTKLKWLCDKGHKWSAIFDSIKNQKQWCPTCGGSETLTLEECQAIAKKRGGECLSNNYNNIHANMRWRCFNGHEWKAKFNNIKHSKTWCPECSGTQKLTLEECQAVATERGGECLSTEYINNNNHMLWRCSDGHEWTAVYNSIKNQQSWCPECSFGKSEQLCREIFEKNLLEKFPNVRPKFLKGLELDGYNKSLNIAFEYQGEQHYKYVPFFHRGDPANFEAQRARDKQKYQTCKERNIKMLLIPYKFSYQNPEELEVFIEDWLWSIC